MIKNPLRRKEVNVCLGDQDDEPPPDFLPSLFSTAPVAAVTFPDMTPTAFPRLRMVTPAKPRTPRLVFPCNPNAQRFRTRFYPLTPDTEWNDWRWQMRNRIRTPEKLRQMLSLSPDESAVFDTAGAGPPLGVTPYYMSLVDSQNAADPIRRSVVPTIHEQYESPGESADPLCEDHQSPVPGLIHRYADRALLLATDVCSTYCRYCTRSRMVGHGMNLPSKDRMETAIDYIRSTPTIRDVLVSGGDPLLLSDRRLGELLQTLRSIPHVEILRIGTKVPAVLPQRITPALVRILRRAHPLWMSLHFTHPDECVAESEHACAMLADAGIPLGSQTVLLKGINDRAETMRELFHHLLRMRVRPYYIYQCDPIRGSAHFRTPVSVGLDILKALRGHTSGYAVPNYVIDAPGGGGKIPLVPETIVGWDGTDLLIRNHDQAIFRYPDPYSSSGVMPPNRLHNNVCPTPPPEHARAP